MSSFNSTKLKVIFTVQVGRGDSPDERVRKGGCLRGGCGIEGKGSCVRVQRRNDARASGRERRGTCRAELRLRVHAFAQLLRHERVGLFWECIPIPGSEDFQQGLQGFRGRRPRSRVQG